MNLGVLTCVISVCVSTAPMSRIILPESLSDLVFEAYSIPSGIPRAVPNTTLVRVSDIYSHCGPDGFGPMNTSGSVSLAYDIKEVECHFEATGEFLSKKVDSIVFFVPFKGTGLASLALSWRQKGRNSVNMSFYLVSVLDEPGRQHSLWKVVDLHPAENELLTAKWRIPVLIISLCIGVAAAFKGYIAVRYLKANPIKRMSKTTPAQLVMVLEITATLVLFAYVADPYGINVIYPYYVWRMLADTLAALELGSNCAVLIAFQGAIAEVEKNAKTDKKPIVVAYFIILVLGFSITFENTIQMFLVLCHMFLAFMMNIVIGVKLFRAKWVIMELMSRAGNPQIEQRISKLRFWLPVSAVFIFLYLASALFVGAAISAGNVYIYQGLCAVAMLNAIGVTQVLAIPNQAK